MAQQKRHTAWLRKAWLLLIIVALVAVIITWWIESKTCSLPPDSSCFFLRFLYEWQTLVAGGLAIAAAFVGGAFIRAQIRLADEHERERIRARYAAARAMLPMALSVLCEYELNCARLLRRLHKQFATEVLDANARKELTLPKLPAATTLDLRTMVQAMNATDGRAIATILAKIQIQASRLSSLPSDGDQDREFTVTRDNIETYIFDAAEIYARAEALFPFARGEIESVDSDMPDVQSFSSAIRQLGFLGLLGDHLEKLLPRHVEWLKSKQL